MTSPKGEGFVLGSEFSVACLLHQKFAVFLLISTKTLFSRNRYHNEVIT